MKKFTIILGIVFLQISLFAQIPTDSLKMYLPFNGSAVDESGNGNNGTVHGAILTQDRFGNENSAFEFDGIDDYISISSIVELPDAFTISTWVYINDFNIGNSIISSYPGAGNDGYEFLAGTDNNSHPKIHINGSEILTASEDDLVEDVWYHLVAIYDGVSNAKIYVNADLVSSDDGFSNGQQNTVEPFIGRSINSLNNFFSGKIDDVRVYNRALDSTEVSTIYDESLCYETITVTDTLIINANITGYNPVVFNNTIKVYPNPASDHLYIDVDDNSIGYELKIINTLSQVVFETTLSQSQYSIDLNSWTGNGTYFVQFHNSNGNLIDVKKIIIQ